MQNPIPPLVLNGRFLTRPHTGVDRVACEISDALVMQLQHSGSVDMRISLPSSKIYSEETLPKGLRSLSKENSKISKGHLWEQLLLPRVPSNEWILNMCNTGPIFKKNQVVMIHDAQVYTHPQTYSKSFTSYYKALLPAIAKRSKVVLTVSDFSRLELENLGVIPPGKAIVVHNGVDHFDRISPDNSSLDKFKLTRNGYFLAIGSLAPHKNLKFLIKAARARGQNALPLIVVGGKNAAVFRDDGLEEGEGVRFLGRVNDSELKALYQGACALTFPSLTEGFGLPPLEAMSCGCPVIASTGGAIPEVCSDAVLYADPFQESEWVSAMNALSSDDILRNSLIKRGSARAALFTWKLAAAKVIDAIRAQA